MVKVRGTGEHRVEALRLADAFRARVIDATTESFVFEITGNTAKIDQFIDLMRPLGLVEVSPHRRCRDRARARRDVNHAGARLVLQRTRTDRARAAVASIYDRHDDNDLRARAALKMLGVERGWRVADIGCGNGVLATEAALMGAEVDADRHFAGDAGARRDLRARPQGAGARPSRRACSASPTSPIPTISSSANSRCTICRISGRRWRWRGFLLR